MMYRPWSNGWRAGGGGSTIQQVGLGLNDYLHQDRNLNFTFPFPCVCECVCVFVCTVCTYVYT